jgi:hypothetical protein
VSKYSTSTLETTDGARQTPPRGADHAPVGIREAAKLKEGDYLEAEVTEAGAILLRPVAIPGRELATMNLERMFAISKFGQ